MSVKRVFFGIFQKLTLFCCAIFFGFANAFSANLPAGYTELEYIESTGTQWIDTGYKLSSADEVKVKVKFIRLSGSGSSYVFGIYGDNANFGINSNSASSYAVWGSSSTEFTPAMAGGTVYDIDMKLGLLTINGIAASYTPSGTFTNTTKNAYLFWANGTTQPKKPVAIYSFQIINNGTLVRDFVPAKNSSGVIGMYDLADTNPATAFHTNAGTGTFTAGPEVLNPCRNLFDTTGQTLDKYIDTSNNEQDGVYSNLKYAYTDYLKVKPNTTYTFAISSSLNNSQGSNLRIYNYTSNKTFIGNVATLYIPANTAVGTRLSESFTTGATTEYLRINYIYYPDGEQPQLEQGSTATAYVPYNASCHNTNGIKIATTAYNTARFSPVVNDLNSTVATIRDIVTNTINQTAAIASLQADKQTRPEDACPAGKKCLLVETEENGVIVPHWYEIIENIYGLPAGYTALEYIQSTGTQYIDTGVKANLNTKAEGVFEIPSGDVGQLFGSYDAGAYFRFYVPTSSLKSNVFDGVGLQTSLLPGDVSRGTKIKITLDKTGLYVGNKTFAYNGTPSAFTATSNIYIGMTSSYTGGTVSEGKVYSFKLYNNDAIVRDFVPAKRDSDSAIGMYDLADPNPATAFYTNSGTGTFSAGQEI